MHIDALGTECNAFADLIVDVAIGVATQHRLRHCNRSARNELFRLLQHLQDR